MHGDLATGLTEIIDSVGTAILAAAEDGEIVFANARAKDLFGALFPEGFDPDTRRCDVAEVLAPIDSLVVTQKSGGFRRPLLRVKHDNVERTFGYTITPVEGGPPGPAYVISFQDVTHVQRLEDERDRLLKLATVGEVMPMLLHETKNPLAAAVTTLELLLEERTEPALRVELHGVLVEIRRALLSLEGLGSVGRTLRSGRAHAIDHAVREVVALMEARARGHGVQLSCEIPSLPLLPLDPSTMRGIVLNLITNAIQACTQGHAHVLVQLKLDEVNTLRLDVIDSGQGMTPDILRRCRELFFTTKRTGTGIGLALCARLVEEAGGTLHIESASGRGTHIAITIPDLREMSTAR
jgi:signal transduction histidine kinase